MATTPTDRIPPGDGAPAGGPRIRRSDLVLSVALPVTVIAVGIAVTIGQEGIQAFVDLCVSVLP